MGPGVAQGRDRGQGRGHRGVLSRRYERRSIADTDRDTLLGTIGRRILTGLLPPRRQRVGTRKVKSPMSRYSERREDGCPTPAAPAPTSTSLSSNQGSTHPRSPRPPGSTARRPAARRRHRILALLQEDPTRLWQPRDIAAHFGDVALETMYRQLNRWAASGLIHKLGPDLYAAHRGPQPHLRAQRKR